MSEIVKLRTRLNIDEEAAAWAWRMDSSTVSPPIGQAYELGCVRIPGMGVLEGTFRGVAILDVLAKPSVMKNRHFMSPQVLRAARWRWGMARRGTGGGGSRRRVVQHGSELQVLATG